MNFTALRRRGISSEIPRYLMTMESNPQVFQICLEKGWCSAEGMTYQDARKVTSLGRDFCFNNKEITHFEEFEYFTGVTMLQTNSFRYATNLKRIVFPDSLIRIADYCFNSCGIEEYDTKNVSIIGNDSFPVCDSVKKITIGSALSSIYNPGSSKSLEEIVVDSENEYYETDGEVLIYKPTNALVIATNTVSDIPEGVEVIRGGAMREIHVTTLTLPSTVNSIGQFLYRSSVTNLISKAVVPPTAAASTFNGATITNIYVPDESIEDYKAAPYWDALASKIQPMSLLLPMMTTATNAEVLSVCYANGWCESPDYMTYAEAKLVDNDMLGTVFSGNTQITHFEEFENFTSITYLDKAFYKCSKLESIKVPDSLTSMGDYVFRECSVLKEITLPNVETVGVAIFQTCRALEYADCPKLKTCGASFLVQCYALKDVNLPLLETNGNSMLQYSSALKKIVLPKLLRPAPNTFLLCNSLICIDMGSMNYIMTGVFSLVNLAQLIIRTPSVASLGSVSYINDTCWVYVPDDLVDSYKSANNWSTHSSQIRPISEYTLYDSEVEYIESNGTQYINCGIYPKGTDIIRCRVSIVDNATSSFAFSAGYSISNRKYSLNVGGGFINYGNGYVTLNPTLEADTIYDITFGNNEITYNGNTKSLGSTITDFECGKVLTLFGESTTFMSKIRLYSFSLEDANGVKKLDMVPVRIGNKGYLYDKVSGELFCNNATNDTFVIGNDVV